jgi:dihydropteroate synthase
VTTLNYRGTPVNLDEPRIMGILNVTPDSFFDGGRYNKTDASLLRTEQMLEEGATFIDIGAYSSRPGAKEVDEEEEKKRLLPVVEAVVKRFPQAHISIDTFRANVARHAIEAGAGMINDISAGDDDASMFETIASLNVPYIIMHKQGTPATMQDNPVYTNVVTEVMDYFSQRIYRLKQLGVSDVIIDPGFGFGKTVAHNYSLLNSLQDFRILECPLMVGLSRKSMVNKVLGIKAAGALNGTTALNTVALLKGAKILRVHDVREASEVVKLIKALHGNF